MLEINVDNPGKYNFVPRNLLSQIIQIFVNLSASEEFIKSMSGRCHRHFTYAHCGCQALQTMSEVTSPDCSNRFVAVYSAPMASHPSLIGVQGVFETESAAAGRFGDVFRRA